MNKTTANIKLGLFVIAGLLFLILLLYMIGKDQNLFGSNFRLKARFSNVQGLTQGNNVRYLGIQVGTVNKIAIRNDTLIEVTMIINTSVKKNIFKDAVASIGTDGLVGNKLINITPGKESRIPVEDGDILAIKKTVDTDDILQSLAATSGDIATIASELKSTVYRINNSPVIWSLLDDKTLPDNIRNSLLNIRTATAKARDIAGDFQLLVQDVKEGRGSLGKLLTDTALVANLDAAILKIQSAGQEADQLARELNAVVKDVKQQADDGKGPLNALLKDSLMVTSVHKSLDNIQKGTEGFNEVMEAMKHNFLLRGYFRKLEKKQKKESQQGISSK